MGMNERRAGIILHPVSLPSTDGIGDFGEVAFKFVDFLHESGMGIWQILPLGPTGYGDSPYTSVSSFAGNPLFISLDVLSDEGLIDKSRLESRPVFPLDKVDYPEVYSWKLPLIRQAASRFLQRRISSEVSEYEIFCKKETAWLEDYAFFMTAKTFFDKQAADEGVQNSIWNRYWPEELSLREPGEMRRRREQWREEIEIEKVTQYFFSKQWTMLKSYANRHGISIFGDIPIFVSPNSADVWAHPELFKLDKNNRPYLVAGVPPDYFSQTGQRWGNPLYEWDEHLRTGFSWWITRIEKALEITDILRIDHFRGFEACWEIAAENLTAIRGTWVKSPGREFFHELNKQLGDLPVVAEDLGVITPEVEQLRREFGFFGMKVLQFAFESDGKGGLNPDNPFLPHNHEADYIVYTGTHDNDTSLGWFRGLGREFQGLVESYFGKTNESVVWDMIRAAFMSPARIAVIPMQDVLNLDSDARMNTPGTVGSNWNWRVRREAFNQEISGKLRWFSRLYGRLPRE